MSDMQRHLDIITQALMALEDCISRLEDLRDETETLDQRARVTTSLFRAKTTRTQLELSHTNLTAALVDVAPLSAGDAADLESLASLLDMKIVHSQVLNGGLETVASFVGVAEQIGRMLGSGGSFTAQPAV